MPRPLSQRAVRAVSGTKGTLKCNCVDEGGERGRGQGLLRACGTPSSAWRAEGREKRSLGLRPELSQQDAVKTSPRATQARPLERVALARGALGSGSRRPRWWKAPQKAAASPWPSARAPQAPQGRPRLASESARRLRGGQMFTARSPDRCGDAATRAAHRAVLAGSGLRVGGTSGRGRKEEGEWVD